MGPDGRALVLWAERNDPLRKDPRSSRPFASVRPAGGSFGPPEAIPSAEPGYQAVGASDARGNVVVLFAVPSRRQVGCEISAECPIQGDLVVSRRPAGGGFSAAGRLVDVAIPLGASVLDSKDRLVVPIAKTERPDDRFEILRLPVRGGGFSLRRYGAYDANVEEVAAAANRRGDVRIAESVAGGRFGGARTISKVGLDAHPEDRSLAIAPQVVSGARGRATIVWSRQGRGLRSAIEARTRRRPGRFGRVRTVAQARSGFLDEPLVTAWWLRWCARRVGAPLTWRAARA